MQSLSAFCPIPAVADAHIPSPTLMLPPEPLQRICPSPKTSAGSIVVTGEGGSTTTNMQQGLCKVWVDGTDAAVLSDSFNISSGTDNGTGDYTYAFSNSLSSVNYSMPMGGLYAALQGTFAQATGSCRLKSFGRADSLTAEDEVNFFAIFGDLA